MMMMSVVSLEMVLGSSYIPKPDPSNSKPLGEDAHFVCHSEQAFGVADGVGGWAKRGIDSGVYARSLMLNSSLAVRSSPVIDPMAVLDYAYAATDAQGSSTACVAVLDGDRLRVANVGDSGLWVFRHNRCAFVSPIQQSRFNCPYQLGLSPGSDTPDSADQMEIVVEEGDVIVCGTDGLLDNVYPSQIEDLLRAMENDQFVLDAQSMADLIAEIACGNSKNECFVSPFETNANEAGCYGLSGGKVDDITVIVAFVNNNDDEFDD